MDFLSTTLPDAPGAAGSQEKIKFSGDRIETADT